MGKIKALFCEGKADSLDHSMLNKLLDKLNPVQRPLIVPTGGKGNMPNFMEGYIQSGGVINFSGDSYLGYRDRDFDAPVPANEELVSGRNPKIKMSYRCTAENYLLNADWLFEYASRHYSNLGITSPVEIADILEKAARDIQYYQAVRHVLGLIRIPIPLDTTWTRGSGFLPDETALEKPVCVEKGWEQIREFKKKASILSKEWHDILSVGPDLEMEKEHFEAMVEDVLAKFDEDFYSKELYLVWFNGKDIEKSVQRQPRFQKVGFSFKSYYSHAIETKFDPTDYEDWKQLGELLSQP